MNERIKELMKQAGTDTSGKWMGVEHAEKFAELIVGKCMNTLQDFKYKSDKFDPSDLFQATHNAVLDTMIDAFKEDFGVEE